MRNTWFAAVRFSLRGLVSHEQDPEPMSPD